MESQLNATSQSIAHLRKRIRGTVITPADDGYEQARMAWNLLTQQHPAVIVIPTTPEEVAEAVQAARAEGLSVAVQTTGHGVILPADDAMLILASRLDDVEINAEDQTAWVGGGAKWQPVLTQAQECGLAPLLGSSPDVGAVGYTLGGGMGWLARKYGLSSDSVRAFQVVTADGQVIHAGPDEHPELFWALRGGGKGLGIVTAMQIQLHPVSTVYAGNLFYPPAMAKEIIARFIEWTANAPDELTSSFSLMNIPPLPSLPEFLRGQSFAIVRGCFAGPAGQGEDLLRFWRDWQAPIIDDFKEIPFTEIASVSKDPVDPLPSLTTSAWLNQLNAEVADALIAAAFPGGAPSPFVFLEVRHAGGAISRQNPRSGAFGNRQSPYILEGVGVAPFPEAVQYFNQGAARLKAALKDAASSYVYLNFLEGEAAWHSTERGFLPDTFRQLQAIKASYDPQNLFRFGLNITPGKPA